MAGKDGLSIEWGLTGRGFGYGEFLDLYDTPCSIQESSLAEDDAIWLGANGILTHHVTGETINQRMHLNREQAAGLIKILSMFVADGDLRRAAQPAPDATAGEGQG